VVDEIFDESVPRSVCPSCSEPNDMAMGTQPGTKPHPGALSVCWKCGHVMVFAEDLTLRDPTDAELINIAGDKHMLKVQAARAAIMGKLK